MGIIATLRQFKIGSFTIFDTVTAYLGILIISPILTKLFAKLHVSIPIIAWVWLTVPIGVVVHMIIHQSTPLMKMFLNPNGDYIAKIVLVLMLVIGLSKIRIIK